MTECSNPFSLVTAAGRGIGKTISLAREAGKRNIIVTAVTPGFIETELLRGRAE